MMEAENLSASSEAGRGQILYEAMKAAEGEVHATSERLKLLPPEQRNESPELEAALEKQVAAMKEFLDYVKAQKQ